MQSAIYFLDSGDKLKDYHKAIYDAGFEIAKENPSLVHDKKKKKLQKLAVAKVDAVGYAYKKKKIKIKGINDN